ncbi:MAG TPA: hypothetical protein VJG83_04545 [archaeon]|nr:hypothetical protein [archaeon]
MEKSGNSKDENRYKIVAEEIEEFKRLVKGHEKLLRAIGEL